MSHVPQRGESASNGLPEGGTLPLRFLDPSAYSCGPAPLGSGRPCARPDLGLALVGGNRRHRYSPRRRLANPENGCQNTTRSTFIPDRRRRSHRPGVQNRNRLHSALFRNGHQHRGGDAGGARTGPPRLDPTGIHRTALGGLRGPGQA
ncbi:hypothetical protein BQ8420_24950 [Nocardiopsis sp. JB363]|nr:hypothetical protein BQ8420_24950 [Nocardiopsis sp. JB363]